MIEITPSLSLEESEIRLDFIRASGPGGQNVNKVATSVQLRFNTLTPSLPEDVRLRLLRLAGKRVNEQGVLIIEASRYRTQGQNRQDAMDRLLALLRQAVQKPKLRRKTRPSLGAKKRRLEAKRRIGEKKRLRSRIFGGGTE